ncbi:MAG: hypothetical protein ACXABK_07070, partial [Candidatus Heimdallarchaeaceae archaeon]
LFKRFYGRIRSVNRKVIFTHLGIEIYDKKDILKETINWSSINHLFTTRIKAYFIWLTGTKTIENADKMQIVIDERTIKIRLNMYRSFISLEGITEDHYMDTIRAFVAKYLPFDKLGNLNPIWLTKKLKENISKFRKHTEKDQVQ